MLVDDRGVLFTAPTNKANKYFKDLSIGEYNLSVDDRGVLITSKKQS